MRVYLFHSKKSETSYSSRVLDHLIKINGLERITDPRPDPDSVDLWLCSVHDPNPEQLNHVRKARRYANAGTRGQLVIAGGFETFGGEYLLNYADALVVGEGFDFFERLGKCRTVEDVRNLFDLPYVWTRGKTRVVPSDFINYSQLPMVKVGGSSYYYLAGRGCVYKCTFCETGFAYKSSHTPGNMIDKALTRAEEERARITFVTNDSVELTRHSPATNTLSMRVVDYLRAGFDRQASMIHFGLEGWTEEQRRFFAKPIEDKKVAELLRLLIDRKQQSELFFIIGQPGTLAGMYSFLDHVPRSPKVYPRIFIKTTRLEPSPHTPFWSYDLDRIETITPRDRKDWYNELSSFNKCFRVFQMLSSARSVWRSAIRRTSTFEEVEWFAGNWPEASETAGSFISKISQAGFYHLIHWPMHTPMPGTQVVTPYRGLRDKLAERRGLPPIKYFHDLETESEP